jgi:hypothetical protein
MLAGPKHRLAIGPKGKVYDARLVGKMIVLPSESRVCICMGMWIHLNIYNKPFKKITTPLIQK